MLFSCSRIAARSAICGKIFNYFYEIVSYFFSIKLTRSSRIFLASRDFFAASLLRFRLSKYFSSFCSSGIGRFSPLGLLINELQKIELLPKLIGDFIGMGLAFGDFDVRRDGEFEEKSELEDIFDCTELFVSGRIDSRGGKL